jgi:phage shock protein PspC (stress-responsive transcriptional regulator)
MTNAGSPGTRTAGTPVGGNEQPYKLMRAKHGRMIGGVAAGLAQASGLDVTVVRLCIGATMLTGLGIGAYILMCFVLPEESPSRGRIIERAPEPTARTIRMVLFGLAALAVLNKVGGFFTFANGYGSGRQGGGFGGLLGLALLAIGVAVLFSRHRPDQTGWESPSPTTAPPTVAPAPAPAPADDGSYSDPHLFEPEHYVDDDVLDEYVDDDEPGGFTLRVGDTIENIRGHLVGTEGPLATVTGRGLKHSGGAALGWARVIGWLAFIWWAGATVGAFVGWQFGALTIGAPWVLGAASVIAAIAVFNALIHVKFASAVISTVSLLLIPTAIGLATVRPVGEVGQRTIHLERVAGRYAEFSQAAGELTLDLRDTQFAEGTTRIRTKVGAGQTEVLVPNTVALEVHTKVRVGSYEVLGETAQGGFDNTRVFTSAGCAGAPKLVLDLETGAGYTHVLRANRHSAATCTAAG